jgi:hypothetical protein
VIEMEVGTRVLIVTALILLSMLSLSAATVPVAASPKKDTGTIYYGSYKEIMVGS